MKNILLSLLLLICATFNSGSFAMAGKIAQTINKGASYLSDGLFIVWALSGNRGKLDTLFGDADDYHSKNSNVKLLTDRFVRKRLQTLGYDKKFIDNLKIRQSKFQDYETYINPVNRQPYINVPKSLGESLSNYYKKKLTQEDRQAIAVAPLLITREAERIENNHQMYDGLSRLAIPVSVHLVAKKSAILFNTLGQFTPFNLNKHSLVKNIFPIVQGACKLGVGLPLKIVSTFVAYIACVRSLEKQADAGVISKIKNQKVLKAGIDYYEKLDKEMQKEAQNEFGHLGDLDAKSFDIIACIQDPVHPRPQKRAEQLRKALKDL